jgi:hypothetical protein
VDASTWDALLQSDRSVVAMFGAPW